jgi:hypothetical protein
MQQPGPDLLVKFLLLLQPHFAKSLFVGQVLDTRKVRSFRYRFQEQQNRSHQSLCAHFPLYFPFAQRHARNPFFGIASDVPPQVIKGVS